MNKPGHEKNVAGSGGIIVLMGFVLGTLIYIAIKTFIIKTERIKELKQWIQRLKDEVEESNKKIAYNIPEIKRLEKILEEIQ